MQHIAVTRLSARAEVRQNASVVRLQAIRHPITTYWLKLILFWTVGSVSLKRISNCFVARQCPWFLYSQSQRQLAWQDVFIYFIALELEHTRLPTRCLSSQAVGKMPVRGAHST